MRDFIVRKTGLLLPGEQARRPPDGAPGPPRRAAAASATWARTSPFSSARRTAAASCAAWSAGSRSGRPTSSATAGSSPRCATQILPDIIRRRRGKHQRLRIWSAGCSTGEEPYSLAILVRELLADIGDWNIHILATDINEDALAAAREGVYRNWSFREVEEHYRQQYFTTEGESSRIRPEVQSMVTLPLSQPRRRALPDGGDRHRRAGPDPLPQRDDLLPPGLCQEITRRFFACLEDQGSLLVGHSEHSDLVYPGFSRSLQRPGDRLPEERPEPGLGGGASRSASAAAARRRRGS